MTDPTPKKPPPRVPVPVRMSPAGKTRIQQAAKDAGYTKYTAWMRDVLAAEALNPKHKPKPRGGD